jgi:hypothetical protein
MGLTDADQPTPVNAPTEAGSATVVHRAVVPWSIQDGAGSLRTRESFGEANVSQQQQEQTRSN